MQTACLFCGNCNPLIFVHGHYQCAVCKTNVLPCCDGDSCNNSYITQSNVSEEEEEEAGEENRSNDNIFNKKKQQNQ